MVKKNKQNCSEISLYIAHLAKNARTGRMHLLKNIISKHIGVNESFIDIVNDGYGRPCIKNCEIDFNLSYSDEFVLVGVNNDGRIGVDIEKIKDFDQLLIVDYFSNIEKGIINALLLEKQTKMCYKIWTAKESFVKAIGLGLELELAKIEVSFFTENDFSVSLLGDVKYSKWFGRSYEINDCCICSVCAKQSKFPENIKIFQSA